MSETKAQLMRENSIKSFVTTKQEEVSQRTCLSVILIDLFLEQVKETIQCCQQSINVLLKKQRYLSIILTKVPFLLMILVKKMKKIRTTKIKYGNYNLHKSYILCITHITCITHKVKLIFKAYKKITINFEKKHRKDIEIFLKNKKKKSVNAQKSILEIKNKIQFIIEEIII